MDKNEEIKQTNQWLTFLIFHTLDAEIEMSNYVLEHLAHSFVEKGYEIPVRVVDKDD